MVTKYRGYLIDIFQNGPVGYVALIMNGSKTWSVDGKTKERATVLAKERIDKLLETAA